SARDIVDVTIENMLADPTMQNFAQSLATLTGGSGAVAVILTDGSLPLANQRQHQLLGASHLSAPQHHQLCQWGLQEVGHNIYREFMRTDAVTLLKEGVELAKHTWAHFLLQRNWLVEQVDKVICHQVGASNRKQVLSALNIPPEKEFPTYQLLGNMGTVSLPVTAAMAHDQGFLRPGDQVSFLGIGSGLNCMMLGIKW
ncbi:MAG: 3-oxoacyl-[acyl-carrier-protein] synthase III C-terminal domain-containing protein, partial [Shewanella sp.]